MTDNKRTCNYQNWDGNPCGRDLHDDEHCIFHSKDIEGKKDKFDKVFWEKEFERQKKDEKKYDFTGFIFPGDISFEEKTFEKDAIFFKAQFSGKANFGEAQFSGKANFGEAQFSGKVYFRDSKFKNAGFGGTQFFDEANFMDVHFYEDVHFTDAKFKGGVSFSEAHFFGKVHFLNSKFCGPAGFESAEFKNLTSFFCTSFSEEVAFSKVIFSDRVSFDETQFSGIVYFLNTKFYGKGESDTRLSEDTRFDFSQSPMVTSFTRFDFSQSPMVTSFREAVFLGRVHFTDIEVKNFNEFNMDLTTFHDVIGLFEFIEKNMGKFNRSYYKEFLPDNFRLILEEKIAAIDPTKTRKIRDDIYLTKLREEHPCWLRVWWLFADCGRSFLRWSLWSILVVVIFAFIYHNIFYLSDVDSFYHAYIHDTWPGFSLVYYSIVTFTTLGFGDILPKPGCLQFWVMLEVILGYIMLGGLISIFANKLARRS